MYQELFTFDFPILYLKRLYFKKLTIYNKQFGLQYTKHFKSFYKILHHLGYPEKCFFKWCETGEAFKSLEDN